MTWDEFPCFYFSELHVRWLDELVKNLAHGQVQKSLSDENIKAAWHWNLYNVPHPPFSRIISGLTKTFAAPWLDRFAAYRLGSALFFAVLTGVMYLWMSEVFGRAAGIFSTRALIATPNLFAFAHIAVTDIPPSNDVIFDQLLFLERTETLGMEHRYGLGLGTRARDEVLRAVDANSIIALGSSL